MTRTDPRYWKGGRGELLLWLGITAGPLAWGLQLGLSYSTSQHVCSTGHEYVFHVITAGAFVLSLAGLYFAHAAWRELPEHPDHESGDPIGRAKFMALCGQIFSIAFSIIVIAGAVPKWVLPPCI